jgi:hypothetical protein
MFLYSKVLVRSCLCRAVTDGYHAHMDSEMSKPSSCNGPHVLLTSIASAALNLA